jgi:hypothetical protein
MIHFQDYKLSTTGPAFDPVAFIGTLQHILISSTQRVATYARWGAIALTVRDS